MISQTMQFDKIPQSIDILLKYKTSNNFIDKIAKFFTGEKSDIKDSLAALLFATEYSLKFHNILNSFTIFFQYYILQQAPTHFCLCKLGF